MPSQPACKPCIDSCYMIYTPKIALVSWGRFRNPFQIVNTFVKSSLPIRTVIYHCCWELYLSLGLRVLQSASFLPRSTVLVFRLALSPVDRPSCCSCSESGPPFWP
ncbi:hypothetical protein Hanom_Chr10g00924791 [Helianthus anomalus]